MEHKLKWFCQGMIVVLLIGCLGGACKGKKNGQRVEAGKETALEGRESTPIVVAGTVIPGEKVDLQMNRDGIIAVVATTMADSLGNFRLEYIPEGVAFFSVSSMPSNKYVRLIGRPGEQMRLDLTGEEVCFSGDGAERNYFIADLQKQRVKWNNEYQAPITDVYAYCQGLDRRQEAFRKYMRQVDLKDQELRGIVEADAMVQHYSSLLKFPFLYQVVTGNTVELPDDYHAFFKEVDLSSPYLNALGNMNSFLQELFTAMEDQDYLKVRKDDYLLKRAELIPEPLVREKYLLYVTGNVELFGYNQFLGRQMDQIRMFIKTPAGLEEWEKLMQKQTEKAAKYSFLNAGSVAMDFSGTDTRGKKRSLQDYRGQVVVVDVWNTGCKPCIAEIPYLKKLEKQFAGEHVVFISYSLDSDVKVWKEFLKTHQMDGNQWIDTQAFKSSLAEQYNIRFIPRFMVFDKAGKIVETYAPRPSNPLLKQLIVEELKK